MRRGWWRRNLWGLIFVLPVTAGLFAFNADLLYNSNFAAQPTQLVQADGSGTAVLGDLEVTLESIESVDHDDPAFVDRDISLPASVQAWRAVMTLSGPEDGVFGCKVELVDAIGRRYPAGPTGLPLGAYGCGPDELDAPSPFTSTFYFLLPAEAQPQALRIIWTPMLPRYAQFPVEA